MSASPTRRIPRPLWITLGWFAALTIGALTIGVAALHYEATRTPPDQLTFGQAVRVIPNLSSKFYNGVSAMTLAGAVYGVAVLVGLYRRRRWAWWLAMVPTFALPPLFWFGDQLIREIEWVYYRKSPYALAFKAAAWPLVIGGLASFCALWSSRVTNIFGSKGNR